MCVLQIPGSAKKLLMGITGSVQPSPSSSFTMHSTSGRAATRLVRHCTRHYSSRQAIQEKNAQVNAFVHISPESGASRTGSLADLRIAVKDNIATKDAPTTCSSAMLKSEYILGFHDDCSPTAAVDFTSPFEATVVGRLREEGADIVGKTNCDEFGMGCVSFNPSLFTDSFRREGL